MNWRNNQPVKEEPVRLERKIVEERYTPKKKYDYTQLLIMIGVMVILAVAVCLIYKSGGSLESTTYYNRFNQSILNSILILFMFI